MSEELYKRFRPQDLDHVVGNKGTVQTLRTMLSEKRVPHTVLFSGPSGCGKTTLARILARELGCLPFDLVELNCAQSRGIDTVREIQRLMQLAPTGKCRVWVLDEVHQWTGESQQAALKVLEDTPRHVYFFLCTTNPQKLLPTIRTRSTDIVVDPMSRDDGKSLLKRVCRKEGIELPDELRESLIDAAEGSPRKLLVVLDRIRNLSQDEREDALKAGVSEESPEVVELCRALLKREGWKKVAKILRGIKVDPESVRWAVLGYMRSVLLGQGTSQAFLVIQAFEDPFYDSREAGLARACFEALQ